MAVSNDPIYPQRPFVLNGVVTAANTDIDDSPDANVVELAMPAAVETDGALITGLTAIPRATTTASVLYLYESLDNGTTRRIIATAAASADTVSTTDVPSPIVFQYIGANISASNPILVPPGASGSKARYYVGASVALAAGWVFRLQGQLLQVAA